VTYTGSHAKQEEHGGFAHDYTNVVLLLSNPRSKPATVKTEVGTAQVAPPFCERWALILDSLMASEPREQRYFRHCNSGSSGKISHNWQRMLHGAFAASHCFPGQRLLSIPKGIILH
jgi:hypothetical protein